MFRFLSFAGALLVAASAVAADPSASQSPNTNAPNQECSKRSDILRHLSHRFSEAPVAMGVATNGGLLEVLTSNSGSSWTIIVTMPDGTACMVAAGQSWENLPPTLRQRPEA